MYIHTSDWDSGGSGGGDGGDGGGGEERGAGAAPCLAPAATDGPREGRVRPGCVAD